MARNPFDTFGTVKEHDSKYPLSENEEKNSLETLDDILEKDIIKTRSYVDSLGNFDSEQIYEHWLSVFNDKQYTIGQLEEFLTFKLEEISENKIADYRSVGLFFSAAYNRIADDKTRCVFKTTGQEKINYFGYKHSKGELTISGPRFSRIATGMSGGKVIVKNGRNSLIGYQMSDGLIEVVGDVLSVGLDMSGGSINVSGDVTNFAGLTMSGGTIDIEGSVDGEIGRYMKNGSISVLGDVVSAGEKMSGGNLYVGGSVAGSAGYGMSGGNIFVKKDVQNVGSYMEDGMIDVSGSVTYNVGSKMTGGEIKVNGVVYNPDENAEDSP